MEQERFNEAVKQNLRQLALTKAIFQDYCTVISELTKVKKEDIQKRILESSENIFRQLNPELDT